MQLTYPEATKRLITPGSNDPEIIPVGVIFHVDAGNATSLFGWFLRGQSGKEAPFGIESHLHLRKDGTWEQYRVFDHEADANGAGNSWVGSDGRRYGFISVETQGKGAGWWTTEQKRELKAFALWASKEFGFPLKQVRTATPGGVGQGGFGYHSLFDAWNALKKPCPGPLRIAWFKRKFVPWLAEQRHQFYVVTEGDSIASVSHKFGVLPAQLWRWNRPLLKPGEKIRVR